MRTASVHDAARAEGSRDFGCDAAPRRLFGRRPSSPRRTVAIRGCFTMALGLLEHAEPRLPLALDLGLAPQARIEPARVGRDVPGLARGVARLPQELVDRLRR